MNNKWENFDKNYFDLFDSFNMNDEMRIHFAKMAISEILKSINDLYF